MDKCLTIKQKRLIINFHAQYSDELHDRKIHDPNRLTIFIIPS